MQESVTCSFGHSRDQGHHPNPESGAPSGLTPVLLALMLSSLLGGWRELEGPVGSQCSRQKHEPSSGPHRDCSLVF